MLSSVNVLTQELALATDKVTDKWQKSHLLSMLTRLYFRQSLADFSQLSGLVLQSLGLLNELGDKIYYQVGLHRLAAYALAAREYDQAEALSRECLLLSQLTGYRRSAFYDAIYLAQALFAKANFEEGQRYLEQSWGLERPWFVTGVFLVCFNFMN